MNTRDQNPQNQTQTSARRPDMLGYTVRQIGKGPKAAWSRVAAAWEHRDGQGYDVRLDALPVDGRLTLRFASDPEDAAEEFTDDRHVPDDATIN